jgi:hypothetical protein
VIEIFQDHARIEQHRAVFEHQCRNLAERILLPHAIAGVHGVGRLDPDLVVETEHAGADPDLANEGRGWGMTERQHGGASICGCDRRDVWRRATP